MALKSINANALNDEALNDVSGGVITQSDQMIISAILSAGTDKTYDDVEDYVYANWANMHGFVSTDGCDADKLYVLNVARAHFGLDPFDELPR